MNTEKRNYTSSYDTAYNNVISLLETAMSEEESDAVVEALTSLQEKIRTLRDERGNVSKGGKHFLGMNYAGELTYFKSDKPVSSATHSEEYESVFGPYPSKSVALFVREKGVENEQQVF